ncbi:class I SAM-dependent methyltransferase (plasmid) [Sinorhizobium sp. M103]|nr:class I SAM-dependent methyltransferase [Sinorhizobium sp. M103]WEJ13728.1 class I SAM-dependent methyltransferase [Sinorhizobium sp. M103]
MLRVDDLHNKTFLDIGSGSGLFSLAARKLGARVHSFDYDPQSVACTRALKQRYFPESTDWLIEEGSVLDADYLRRLGQFDIVYSWGVLHHTGAMWQALENVDGNVSKNGKLFIALYNYQPLTSKYWTHVKRLYNKYSILRPPIIFIHLLYPALPSYILKYVQGRKLPRGMSFWYDHLDWLGGYPFEVSTPKQIFDFYREKGYRLDQIKTVGDGTDAMNMCSRNCREASRPGPASVY